MDRPRLQKPMSGSSLPFLPAGFAVFAAAGRGAWGAGAQRCRTAVVLTAVVAVPGTATRGVSTESCVSAGGGAVSAGFAGITTVTTCGGLACAVGTAPPFALACTQAK